MGGARVHVHMCVLAVAVGRGLRRCSQGSSEVSMCLSFHPLPLACTSVLGLSPRPSGSASWEPHVGEQELPSCALHHPGVTPEQLGAEH